MNLPSLLPWIRVMRLPAVLTVPGDLWVGAVIAGRVAELREIAAVCLAYVLGMVLNDLWDRERDARERPERPLPSGALSLRQVIGLSVLLAGGALALLPGLPLILLLGTIAAYTLLKCRSPFVGAALMGLCRFQSVWIGSGADTADTPAEWAVPLGAGTLIFLITRLSQVEGTKKNASIRSGLFAAGLVAAAGMGMWMGGKQGPSSWALMGAVAGVAIANHAAIERKGELPPSAIGIYLCMWIPLQAIWVLGAERALEGAVLVGAAIALPWLQRQIAIA